MIFVVINGVTLRISTTGVISAMHTEFCSLERDKEWLFLCHRATQLIRLDRRNFIIQLTSTWPALAFLESRSSQSF
jgi:hypothetical protein